MNVEKLLDTCYKVFLTGQDQHRLEIIANTFYHGNTTAALSEIFSEGLEVSEAVKQLLEDTKNQEQTKQKFCETQRERVDRLWKGQKDASKSTDE